ncbi:MAG: class I SAM-dependent methyltransferase [Anaerolineae bacterium]|nr:class I SAM-dependent methyltransferase [Anaerolineae bacterium]
MDNQNTQVLLQKIEELGRQNDQIARQLAGNDQQIYNLINTQMQVLYRQMEALFSLYSVLPIRYPLPQMRGWPVSPDFAAILINHIFEYKPLTIFELGSGLSTIFCAYALEKLGRGRIISLDHEQQYYQKSQKLIEDHALTQYVQLIHAPLVDTLIDGKKGLWYDQKNLPAIEQIDMLIVDGPPSTIQDEARYPALPLLKKFIGPHTLIFLDDAGRPDEQKTVKRWLELLPGFHVESLETEKGIAIIKKDF